MPPVDADPVRQALEAFQQRRLPHAEAILKEYLPHNPDHAAALNLLGVVCHAQGRREEALAYVRRAVTARGATAEHFNNLAVLLHDAGQFADAVAAAQKAVELNPRQPESHYHLGNALLASRRSDEAIAAYHQALQLKPDYLDAFNNLGGALRQQGRLREAIACCRQVIALTPADPKMHLNLGSLLRDIEQFDEAVAAYRQATTLQPDYLDAWQNLGSLLRSQRRLAEAAECFQTILKLQPGHPQARMDLGGVLQAQGRFAEAAGLYQQVLASCPASAASWSALGTTYQEQGQLEQAVDCYRKAVATDPHFPAGHMNLGTALAELDRYDEAIACYRQALRMQPDFYEAWNNIGNAYLDLGQPDQALHAYQRAITIRPDFPDGHWNKSLLLLLEGRYEEGFAEYEWRWLRFKEFRRNLRQPLWDGSDLEGRTLVVHAEQGFGDTLQFARYLPRAAAMNGRVLVECQVELKALLQTIPGPERVYAQSEPLPDFQLQIPVMTLPLAFAATLDTLPRDVPYLHADPERAALWRKRLAADGPAFRVGLSWAGRNSHKRDRQRSCSLAALAPLASVPGVKFYSLQKWKPARLDAPSDAFPLIDYTSDLIDFADTAALMANLDLIIGVDTAIVHLAGALGRPVWTLLAFNNDWRWLRGRADSPWYPTMRLFRQPRAGDWAPAIAAIASDLARAAHSA